MGLDIAKQVSESLAPSSEWNKIERSIENAKHDAGREIALNVSSTEGNRRDLAAFHRIEVNGSLDVIVRRSASTYVDFLNDSDASSHTQTTVSNGSLIIDTIGDSHGERRHKPILIYTPIVDAIAIDGSACVEVESASGERLAVDISGSGGFAARGNVTTADIHLEGSGDANIVGLVASTISVMSEGSGDVKLTAPQTLNVHLEGSGDVTVHGTPKHLSSQIDGSGDIIKL